ncbi:MAG: DivIVA domain-containing protein [Fibrobacter sp.]|nr:DivIVA domain-containing protein [Fibrobacter sp.]
MHITPLDIRNQPFKKVWRGYDIDLVRAFCEQVATEYESVIRQNSEFATQIKNLEQRLEGFTKIERILNETLLTAQKATDEARVNAQKEAELILKDANLRAERYEDEARQRVHNLESEIVALRNQRDSFLARFKAMLTTQLNLLEIISGDLKEIHDDPPMQIADDETLAEVPPQPSISSLDV